MATTAKKTAATPPKKTTPKKPDPKKTTDPKKDRLSQADLAAKYGYVQALLNSNKELRDLFAAAYGTDKKGQWTAEKFQTALRNTDWFKKHSAAWRSSEALFYADRATFDAKNAEVLAEVRTTAGQMGAVLSPEQEKALAESYFRSGYTPSQVRQALSSYIVSVNGSLDDVGGTAGESLRGLREYADQMGVKRDGQWLLSASRSIATGLSTIDDWIGEMREEAKTKYVALAPRIDAGMTVRDIASTYLNQMADTLELDVDQIGLDDPSIQRALMGKADQQGMPTTETLWDFDQSLRKDPRWALTKNANATANGVALNVLQAFGFNG
jgi:peptidoglycan hydrolase-like protein with peptidoglycan-binding domain